MSTPPMNRAQKRAMQKMGALTAEGTPTRTVRTPPTPRPKEERATIRTFLKEVRAELRKVVWPNREEVRNYSIVVLITVILLTTFIAVLDYLFGSATLWLYSR